MIQGVNYLRVIWADLCARTHRDKELLLLLANTEIERIQGMQSLFIEHDD